MIIITDSKEIRNWIITLIILAIGLWLLLTVGKTFIASATSSQIGVDKSVVASLDSISLLMTLGIVVLIALLIPIYFVKRSQEKKDSVKQVK